MRNLLPATWGIPQLTAFKRLWQEAVEFSKESVDSEGSAGDGSSDMKRVRVGGVEGVLVDQNEPVSKGSTKAGIIGKEKITDVEFRKMLESAKAKGYEEIKRFSPCDELLATVRNSLKAGIFPVPTVGKLLSRREGRLKRLRSARDGSENRTVLDQDGSWRPAESYSEPTQMSPFALKDRISILAHAFALVEGTPVSAWTVHTEYIVEVGRRHSKKNSELLQGEILVREEILQVVRGMWLPAEGLIPSV